MWREPLTSDELWHYGVLGMHWGERKDRSTVGFSRAQRKVNAKSGKEFKKFQKQEARKRRRGERTTEDEYQDRLAEEGRQIEAQKKKVNASRTKAPEEQPLKPSSFTRSEEGMNKLTRVYENKMSKLQKRRNSTDDPKEKERLLDIMNDLEGDYQSMILDDFDYEE